jgi:biopolymer transport protein ExbD
MGIKTRNKVDVSFSMSSMTDIVFLLLIFFIIASTLITPNALNILLPQSSPSRAKKQPATIEVTSDGIYALNGEIVNFSEIEPKLKAQLNSKDENNQGIVLKADKNVALEYVVKVMDIANKNHYKMVLATKGGK